VNKTKTEVYTWEERGNGSDILRGY